MNKEKVEKFLDDYVKLLAQFVHAFEQFDYDEQVYSVLCMTDFMQELKKQNQEHYQHFLNLIS